MAHVLLVEDDPDVGEALADVLRMQGNVLRTAVNGEDGLRALSERSCDVILLDVEMPVLDGPGMVDRMRVEDRGLERLPIVLISGVPNLPKVAARVGTPYYLLKPYSLDELFRVVDRALEERSAPRPRVEHAS